MQNQTQGGSGPEFQFVSTGHLPTRELAGALVAEGHASSNTEGENSQVYPALARVPPDLFGIPAICQTNVPPPSGAGSGRDLRSFPTICRSLRFMIGLR